MKSSKRIVENPEKWFHRCGESVKVYNIEDNAPYCMTCRPDLVNKRKKIPSEAAMLQKILEGEKHE